MIIQCEPKYLTLFNFFKEAFQVLEPGTPLQLNWHHKVIADALQAETYRILKGEKSWGDLVINVPFRSTKSVLATVCWPAWAWVIDPTQSFLTVSYSGQLSTKHARLSRKLINSDWYQSNFGHIFELTTDQNVKSHYENNKAGERFATSMTGTATGTGADVILIDDPLNPKEASSEKERANANTNYRETFYSRTKNPSTAVRVVIMQRLHEEDLSGHLLEEGKVRHVCIPGEEGNNIKPKRLREYYQDGLFWPDRMTKEVLDDYKTGLGSYAYAGQILQRPAPAEGGLIKRNWFEVVDKAPEGIAWNFVIDPAYTSNTQNDPTALMAYAYDGKDWYIRNVTSAHLEFPDLVNLLQSYVKDNGYTRASMIKCEPKASGLSLIQTLRRETGLNIWAGKAPEKDKVARVSGILATLESRRVKLIRGSWNDSFLHQCTAFPNAKHDDEVDCLVMALTEKRTVIR